MTQLQAAVVIAFGIVGGILAAVENAKQHWGSTLCYGVMALAVSVVAVAVVLAK